jgi:ectoine hydroxylase-related dioxygenase (phytanoyl-CoA dioxygenase family)
MSASKRIDPAPKDSSYGNIASALAATPMDEHAEQLRLRGFTILEGVLEAGVLADYRGRIDAVYARQKKELGEEFLINIQELDMCVAPLLYDDHFLDLATNPQVLALVRKVLGKFVILHLQNAFINRPGGPHHQSSWHRDLPYQNFVISSPLAIGALFAMDDFTQQTGGTQVVPFSHRMEAIPSPAYLGSAVQTAEMKAGSVMIFDAMVIHRAGVNRSAGVRRGVNHVYTVPILKQQYDFPAALGDRFAEHPELADLLGYTSKVPPDDRRWRQTRARRKAAT